MKKKNSKKTKEEEKREKDWGKNAAAPWELEAEEKAEDGVSMFIRNKWDTAEAFGKWLGDKNRKTIGKKSCRRARGQTDGRYRGRSSISKGLTIRGTDHLAQSGQPRKFKL